MNKIYFSILLLLLCTLASTFCSAFWATGHMLVSTIAREELKRRGHGNLVPIMDSYATWLQTTGEFPEIGSSIELASWPDDIKEERFGHFTGPSAWHYTNYVFRTPSDFMPPTPVPGGPRGCPLSKQNAADLCDGFFESLSLATRPKQHNNLIASLALAFAIHIYGGDLHQPLHCASMFSSIYPHGDLGGNREKIVYYNSSGSRVTSINLHGYFDSVAGLYAIDTPRPLSASKKQWLENEAAALYKNFTLSEAEANLLDPHDIANESFSLAKKYAYRFPNGTIVRSGDVLGEAFHKAALPVLQRQLVRGGVRLARRLEKAMANSTSSSSSGSDSDDGGFGSGFAGGFFTCFFLAIIAGVVYFFVWKRNNGAHRDSIKTSLPGSPLTGSQQAGNTQYGAAPVDAEGTV